MEEIIKEIKNFYNASVLSEWNRIDNRPEFLITCRFIDRYIKSGHKILDIGGGPGRYSLYLANKGCDVVLFDLSDENVKFALKCAEEQNVNLKGVVGDARTVDEGFKEKFDHILLMGPMYHLLEEHDRVKAINAALKLLKSGGTIFISFINMIAGIIYAMKCDPEIIASTDESELEYYKAFINNGDFSGQAFTKAYFINQDEILPFMERFSLEKLHFIGQESITSPCEDNIMSKSKEIVEHWLDFCEKICEREDLLSWSEHLMYIGRKIK